MSAHVFAAVLAGGQSRRFGADKALAHLGGASMIVHVAERLRLQAQALAVVGHPAGAALLRCTELVDPPLPARGPLLGILAALEWAAEAGADWLVTAPCDVPLIPNDLAARLIAASEAQGVRAAFAVTASGFHPLCAAWSPSLAAGLREQLAHGDHPPVHEAAGKAERVFFAEEDAFANINTPDEFARISAAIRSRP